MKDQNRILRNRNTKTAARQRKTPSGKTGTVIFYSSEDDQELFRVELPEVLVTAVARAAKKMRVTTGRYFELAAEEYISSKSHHGNRGAK
jgi:hypothetical protein